MIKNRKDVAKEWFDSHTLSYAEVGRNYNLDRRTVWSLVRSYYTPEEIAEKMELKRANRRKMRCKFCDVLYEVKYPCLRRIRKPICDECKTKRVSSPKVTDGEPESSK